MRRAAVLALVAVAVWGGWWLLRERAAPASAPGGTTAPVRRDGVARGTPGPDAAGGDGAAESAARALPGGELTVRRQRAAALAYSTRVAASLPADALALVDAAARRTGVELRVDAALARAATEIATLASQLGEIPPEPALTFLLHSSGAPDGGVSVHLQHAALDDDRALAQVLTAALGALPDGEGPVRLGVGEASSDGPLGQTTAVVLGRVAFELDGVATSARPGETWRLALTPGRGWHDLEALALGEDGALREVPVRVGAGEARLEVEVPVDAPPGTSISVGVDGTGPHGPGKLAQLTLWVGDAPPATAAVQVAAAEPADLSLDGAERLALAYLAADRARAGKPALVPDDALAAIARRHSEDMAARGYFGHASPTTGLAGDRLRAAGYLALAHGENLAKNDHLGEAEVSLWESLGHRANIVGDAFTHVGVGIARVPGDDGGWLVTQLFARPAPPVSAATVDTLLAQINAARVARGARPLVPRGALVELAEAAAARLAREPLRQVLDDVSRQLTPRLRAPGSSWAATGADVTAFTPPDSALAKAARSIGLAAAQDPASGAANVVVIVEE